MYLDTDCVLALIKESDWLKVLVGSRLKEERDLCTSVITVIECKLVISREEKRDHMHDTGSAIKNEKIGLLPLDERIILLSNDLLKKYEFLGIFDSIHAATSIVHDQTLLSTDHIFPLLDELVSEDPRGRSLDFVSG